MITCFLRLRKYPSTEEVRSSLNIIIVKWEPKNTKMKGFIVTCVWQYTTTMADLHLQLHASLLDILKYYSNIVFPPFTSRLFIFPFDHR